MLGSTRQPRALGIGLRVSAWVGGATPAHEEDGQPPGVFVDMPLPVSLVRCAGVGACGLRVAIWDIGVEVLVAIVV